VQQVVLKLCFLSNPLFTLPARVAVRRARYRPTSDRLACKAPLQQPAQLGGSKWAQQGKRFVLGGEEKWGGGREYIQRLEAAQSMWKVDSSAFWFKIRALKESSCNTWDGVSKGTS